MTAVGAALSAAHCRRITYRGRPALVCRLCGRLVTAVVAHFAATHRSEYETARSAT